MIEKLEEELKNLVSWSEDRLILNYLHNLFPHDNSIELLHDFFVTGVLIRSI